MNKNELAVQMVKDTSITKVDALKIIDTFIGVVSDELKTKGGKLTLVGFGTFKTIIKKQKKGRNPRTSTEIMIPQKRAIKFVPGKKLKEVLESMTMVAEGVQTTKSVVELADNSGVETPIACEVYNILFEDKDPTKATYDLMTRDMKTE